MATDVYRAPEMRHRVGEKHHSIWEGSGGAGMPPWKGQNGGCWTGGCLAPCPQSPSLAEGPWAASCRGRFGFVQGLLPQPCSGEVPGAWHNQPRLCQPPAQELQGWEFAVSWGVLALALPHSLSLQNTSAPFPELPGADSAAVGAGLSSSAMEQRSQAHPGCRFAAQGCIGGISQFCPQPQSTGWC